MKIKIEFDSEEEKKALLETFRHSYRDEDLTLEQVEDLLLKQSTRKIETNYLIGAMKKARLEGKSVHKEIHNIKAQAKAIFSQDKKL